MAEKTIENERKYLLEDPQKIEYLKRNNIKKMGIIQWYEETEDPQERIRLTIFYDKVIGHTHFWKRTTKTLTDDPEKRFEEKHALDPRKLSLLDLENKRNVVKIRYLIKENPKIVLDEFLKIDNEDISSFQNGNPKEHYLEIETKEHKDDSYFENELKSIGLEITDVKDLTKEKSYQNFYKAEKREVKPLRIIEYVQNKLIGPVTVILTQGKDNKGECEKLVEKIKNGERLDKSSPNDKLRPEMEIPILFKNDGFEINEVYFIVYPDEENKNEQFYECLKEFIKTTLGPEIKVDKLSIDYKPDDQEKAYDSTNQIWKTLDKITKNDKNSVLIDITGGHKYPGFALATYCLLNQKAFYYKQDKTNVHLKFPPFPIGWNYEVIDENSQYMDKIENNHTISYGTFSTLPEFLKDLFALSQNDLDIINIAAIEQIKREYKKARKLPFGHGRNFIDLIRDEKMINFVNEKIPLWSLRWIGDLIPETVEHSQRHSKRLMEFGFSLVRIMGEENFLNGIDPDLRKEFYFILAVAMNVHDLGHTVLNYITDDGIEFCIDGLPSVVRDLHSELSYQLIENENILDGIEKIDEDKEKIEKLKKAIMYVSKYHRQYLPIGENENPSSKKFTENLKMKIKSLEGRLNEDELFEDSKKWKEMIMLASRWLKFIDSTDVQSDRTVMDEYTQIRVQRTKDEIESLCYDFLANNSMLSKLDMAEKILRTLKYLNAQNWGALDDVACEIEDLVYKEIRSKLENAVDKKVIFIDEYIKKADRIAFKSRQFRHFEKHQAVKSIMPEFYNPKEKKLYLKIYSEDKVSEENIDKIKEDIKKEFENSCLTSANKKLENLEIES
jgi:hypothetical protein